MRATLWRAGLRFHRQHPWQAFLAIVGIALGVAVVTAIDLANRTAERSFALSVEAVSGRATHRLAGSVEGLPDKLYTRLRLAGFRDSAPLVSGYLEVGERTFRLLGVDPLAESPFRDYLSLAGSEDPSGMLRTLMLQPGTVLMGAETAADLGIDVGATLPARIAGGQVSLTVAGLIGGGSEFDRQLRRELLVADIATAQSLLGMEGRLSQIDLVLEDTHVVETLRALLPPGVRLEPVEAHSEAMAQMTRAFSVNLTALSLLALVVGMFLIYNTMAFSVLQRQQLWARLRAVGVTRGQIFLLIGAEALLLGAAGSALGLAGGVLLGEGLLGLVIRTINDLYFTLQLSELAPLPGRLAKAFALGLGASVAAALSPAVEAARVPPHLAMSRAWLEGRRRRAIKPLAVAGVATAGLGVLLLAVGKEKLTVGFAGLGLLLAGYAVFTPALAAFVFWLTNRGVVARGHSITRMALRNLPAGLSRTAVAVTALTVAVAVTAAVAIMVASFRLTVQAWLEHTLQADIYISSPGRLTDGQPTPVTEAVLERVRQTPGVKAISTYWRIEARDTAGPVPLVVVGLGPSRLSGYIFREGNAEAALKGLGSGGVLISEPYAYRQGVRLGDAIVLQTGEGPRRFRIAGVFYDYSSDRGLVQMTRATYRAHWGEPEVGSVGAYLAPGAQSEQVIESLRTRLAGLQPLRLRSNRELREASLAIFDRTFAITEVLRLIAVAVAFLGVLGALLALQLERAREFALLKAMGMLPGELRRLVTMETTLLGAAAGLLAAPLSLLLALLLILVINRRAFGWSLQVAVPPEVLLQGLLLAVVAAMLAALYPAQRAATASPATTLRGE